MTLYIIGLGLCDQNDISVKGLKIIKSCEKIYLENYTSLLQCSIKDLEELYGKKITVSDRNSSEQGMNKIILEAKDQDVAFLVIGDPVSATTHIDIWKEALEKGTDVKIINNASIFTAIGITGLQLYKFGKTTSIPFLDDFPELETPYNILKKNKEIGYHTLFLLDIKADKDRFMTIKQAIDVLKDIESRKKEGIINDELFVVGCSRLGCPDFKVRSGKLKEINNIDFGKSPHCLIIPGDMHFLEEEILEFHNKN